MTAAAVSGGTHLQEAEAVVAQLRQAGLAGADASPLARGMYSSDASLYRVLPLAVVRPGHVDELQGIHEVAQSIGVPVTMRGAGTSIAGNAVGEGIVVDTRDLNRVIEIDPESRTALVEPGVVHADLQRAGAPYGLRFGPDPSTHTRCTIGGMIGNNACGSRALGYGRTADNVVGASILFGNGELAGFGTLDDPTASAPGYSHSTTAQQLIDLAGSHLGHIRTSFGQFDRQVSGYSLEHLLPENRHRVERFIVGSEGSLGTVLRARVRLVEDDPGRRLLVLGYHTVSEAADAVSDLLNSGSGRLIACEGMDSRLVALVRSAGKPVPELPRGESWLFVEAAGDGAEDVLDQVRGASGALGHRFIDDPAEAAALWKIREDGAGLAGISLETPAYSGWEDAAVPPAHLGSWMREFETLIKDFGLQGYPYGHFGDGCIHCRIDFPFTHGDPSSTGVFREFMLACAERLRPYGGSLSGEHGDGRVRSELLPYMYDATSISLFEQVKAICDPEGLLNPGIIANPVPQTQDIRAVQPRHELPWPGMRMTHDAGSFGAAAHRCSGVGKCVAPKAGGVMCPSYLATRQEKDSTRGRARILQEAMDGSLVQGLADPAVHEALDLCLSCKGCASDCPAGVDMAAYKAEALYQTYDGGGLDGTTRRRPRSHYVLGRLPVWARLAAPVAGLANATMRVPPLAAAAKWFAGIDQRRGVPRFAAKTLHRAVRSRAVRSRAVRGRAAPGRTVLGRAVLDRAVLDRAEPSRAATLAGQQVQGPAGDSAQGMPDVWIWADSFTNHFFPQSGLAAMDFLQSQGLEVRLIEKRGCCGLPWISTGQLDQARRLTEEAVTALAPYVDSGVPVIGLEPSCLATLRSDAVELSSRDEAARVAQGMKTFAELITALTEEGRIELPDLTGVNAVAQPHCHQSAVIGWASDEAILKRAGAAVTKVAGCCGLAGNFGVEKGHYDVSVAVAETHLLPAVRTARTQDPETVILADGMSCRIQLDDLGGVPSMHLAELLASRTAELG